MKYNLISESPGECGKEFQPWNCTFFLMKNIYTSIPVSVSLLTTEHDCVEVILIVRMECIFFSIITTTIHITFKPHLFVYEQKMFTSIQVQIKSVFLKSIIF